MSNSNSISKIVFLDYHGVLTDLSEESLCSPPDVKYLKADSLQALQLLKDYYLFVVSNQAGIAFGDYDLEQLDKAIKVFIEQLQSRGILLIDFFYCPHHPEAKVPIFSTPCNCRKPNPYFIYQALLNLKLKSANCVFVGDSLETDIACARAAGIKSVWINSTKARVFSRNVSPDATHNTLLNAVPTIKLLLKEGEFFV